MTEIKRVTFKCFNEQGEEISFADYVKEYGEIAIYEKDIGEILKGWRHADWIYTDDFISPLAARIITDTCELDGELFSEIMTTIEKAYNKIAPIIKPNQLTRIK